MLLWNRFRNNPFLQLSAKSLCLVFMASLSAQAATVSNIRVIALIDGRDRLVIQGDTIQWQHFDYAAVGRHQGQNYPTHLHVTNEDGFSSISWRPDWPQRPPNEIRYRANSSVLEGFLPSIGEFGTNWSIKRNWTRCAGAYIVQQPRDANDHRLIVEFNDNRCKSSAVFDIVLTGQTVSPVTDPTPQAPVPIPTSGLLLGGVLCAGLARKLMTS